MRMLELNPPTICAVCFSKCIIVHNSREKKIPRLRIGTCLWKVSGRKLRKEQSGCVGGAGAFRSCRQIRFWTANCPFCGTNESSVNFEESSRKMILQIVGSQKTGEEEAPCSVECDFSFEEEWSHPLLEHNSS